MQKRSLSIAGHRTSIALEAEFWSGLEQMALERGTTITALIRDIDESRAGRNLSSSLRVAVLSHYREQLERR